MKKTLKYLGLAVIMVFSFYYTEQIALIVLNKNPLMQEIKDHQSDYEIKSVNATIEGEYIIPGLNGIEINLKDSFYKMHELNVFNKYFLVFNQVKPQISLEKNKDKIITNANSKLNKVSLILETQNYISTYLKENNLKASLLVTKNTYQKNNYFEVINNDLKNFKELENTLNLNKENKNICVLNQELKSICKKYQNYLVEPKLILNSSNYIDIKKELKSGSIILISSKANLTDVKMLIKEINYKGLQIVPLSEIIKEEKSN